mgnify:CR=1 FL=1
MILGWNMCNQILKLGIDAGNKTVENDTKQWLVICVYEFPLVGRAFFYY